MNGRLYDPIFGRFYGVYKQFYRYSFDAVNGNLSSRQNYLRNMTENFTYDNLERLLTVSGPQNLTMTYNANGNVSTKSDIDTTAFRHTRVLP